jgi:hypothetical protein
MKQPGGSGGHPGPTVVVYAPAEQVHRRSKEKGLEKRSLSAYVEIEYNQKRNALYALARCCCDVSGLSLDAARAHFVSRIREILKGNPGKRAK